MFTLLSPSKYSPFEAMHWPRCIFHSLKQFWNTCKVRPFNASVDFFFISSTSAKSFPLRTFFYLGEQNTVVGSKVRWLGRVGKQGHAIFGQKLSHTQGSVCWHNVVMKRPLSTLPQVGAFSSRKCFRTALSVRQFLTKNGMTLPSHSP